MTDLPDDDLTRARVKAAFAETLRILSDPDSRPGMVFNRFALLTGDGAILFWQEPGPVEWKRGRPA